METCKLEIIKYVAGCRHDCESEMCGDTLKTCLFDNGQYGVISWSSYNIISKLYDKEEDAKQEMYRIKSA